MFRIIKKSMTILMMCFLIFGAMAFFVACEDLDMSFENRCKTSTDGFVYYEDSKIGLCIIALPDSEDVVIPEFIDGKEVKQLGYQEITIGNMKTHTVLGGKTKKLTISHPMNIYSASLNLNSLVYIDFIFIEMNNENQIIKINNIVGNSFVGQNSNAKVELLCSDRSFEINDFKPTIIEIPEYVTRIDSNAFYGINDVTFKVAVNQKPESWANDWNGDCEVEWGAEL